MALLREGKRPAQVGRELRVTKACVVIWARKHGIALHARDGHKQPGWALVRRMLGEGLAPAEVARQIGQPEWIVVKWAGLPARAPAIVDARPARRSRSAPPLPPAPAGPEGAARPRPRSRTLAAELRARRKRERREQALQLLRQGTHASAVARSAGISESTVRKWAKIAGVVSSGIDPLLRENALALLRGGVPYKDITKQTRIGYVRLRRWAASLGIVRQRGARPSAVRPRPPGARVLEIAGALLAGEPVRPLAAAFGISPGLVYYVRNRFQIEPSELL